MLALGWQHALNQSTTALCARCCCTSQVEKVLRNKVGFLQAQVDELQQKQVELLAQKQQLQVGYFAINCQRTASVFETWSPQPQEAGPIGCSEHNHKRGCSSMQPADMAVHAVPVRSMQDAARCICKNPQPACCVVPLWLQVSHQQEMARYGHVKTTAELQAMVAALQKEVDTHAGHARKAAVSMGQGRVQSANTQQQCIKLA